MVRLLIRSFGTPPDDLSDAIDRELAAIHASALGLAASLPSEEHLFAVSSRGTVLWAVDGTENGVVIGREFDAVLYQAGARIVLLHNHPSSASLSGADLEQLAKPGVESIVAVGHDGSVFVARAGPRYEPTQFIGSLYSLARSSVTQQLRIERPSFRVATSVVNAQFEHLVAQSLHKAGIIRYRAIFPSERQDTDPGWRRLSGVVTNSVAAKLKAALRATQR